VGSVLGPMGCGLGLVGYGLGLVGSDLVNITDGNHPTCASTEKGILR
jgi:hypothetical protein